MARPPQDPVTKSEQIAIEWHETFLAYKTAGFSEDQAFQLLISQCDAYWGATYTRGILYGGEPLHG